MFAEWLAYGLEQVFAETPQIGIVRKLTLAALPNYRGPTSLWVAALMDVYEDFPTWGTNERYLLAELSREPCEECCQLRVIFT